MIERAYVPRRKRRRTESSPPTVEFAPSSSIANAPVDPVAEQEAAWARQERGIVVEGEGSIPAAILAFDDLTLSTKTLAVLQSRGVATPSAVQAQALPCVFQGRDVIALAPTGSGKTLCYILPILKLLQQSSQVQPGFLQYPPMPMVIYPAAPSALVVVPTRELVDQVVQDLSGFFLGSLNAPVVGICGGIPLEQQAQQLRCHASGTFAVVATPGRLLHLVQYRVDVLSLANVALVVVDEVDRVLQVPQMETQLQQILQVANTAARQTMLLSATMPAFLPRLARSAVLRPVTIHVNEAVMPTKEPSHSPKKIPQPILALATASKVTHDVQFMRSVDKTTRLLRVLRSTKYPPVLVFCNSRSSVERVARLLRSEQFHVAPLHGGQSQSYRTQALRAFRAGYVDVLVATDLASRGLDLPGVEHVILFDMPLAIEDYVHRCGRTGRHPGGDTGGEDVPGKATSFLTHECSITAELKQVLLATGQSVPRELELPRVFQLPPTQLQELQ